jgi:hypothetical protein
MKPKSYWLLGILLVLCLMGWTGRGQGSKIPRPVWEYKIVTNWLTNEADLNKLGAEGWELVQYDPGVRGGNASANERYFFRRTK